MRGMARLTGHETCMRVDENYTRLNKMADVSDTQENPELQAMSKSLPVIIRRGKKILKNVITYHRQVTVGGMTGTVRSLTSVKKTKKNN